MSTVIKVENISKQYRLGVVGTGSLAHDLNRIWHKVRGKEDPYLKVGEANDRAVKGSSDYVWALNNINFDVKQGEVLGIIGRNGAGKSTLLKILSRTTTPTTGSVKIKGRVASLLEVGTGFHPELSGRENIFLNGAILGMTRHEIKKKFDEIVEFAGVERYIDTPVKRYSSGMYVRLAFGVAAHLEPEILIVDEVLAVGDAEFQKKALGKMKDVSSNEGRTVLFVSHNMAAVRTLCPTAIILKNGTIHEKGDSNDLIDRYIDYGNDTDYQKEIDFRQNDKYGNDHVRLLKAKLETNKEVISLEDSFSLFFEFENFTDHADLNISMVLYTREDVCVFNTVSEGKVLSKGLFSVRCHIPGNLLNDENYSVRILVVKDKSTPLIDLHNVINIMISEGKRDANWYGKWVGVIRPHLKWEFVV